MRQGGVGRARIHAAGDVPAVFQQHPETHGGCGELSHNPGASGRLQRWETAPCSVNAVLVPRERRDPFPGTAGSPGRVCCHCLHFAAAISRDSVSALHAGAAPF